MAERLDQLNGTRDWRNRAACRREEPELFFPTGKSGSAVYQIYEAKQVCNGCEVREACLTFALENGLDHGVWGGMSEDERKQLRRRNQSMGKAAHSGS